jgi:hypothetical protein
MVCVNGDGWMRRGVSSGDGIEAAFGEGMAADEAAESQPGASEEAETNQGYVGVLGAGGEVETLRRAEGVEDGGEDGLVDAVSDANG